MKFMIASDIHGSAYWCEKMIGAFENEKAERLILLGDLLYHGPRNDLPKDYAPKKVIEMLNTHKDEILCVRGNCEAEVDQMVLEFPVLAEYALISAEGAEIFATHGHKWSEGNLPPLKKGNILLCGHTHIPACNIHENYVYMNPGSVSIPKNGSANSYMTLENGCFLWKNFDGETYNRFEIK